jgi:MoaA/NifB/PqqE/SkfB family radical SAM enzyme/alpha-beta hydrolase superfamily lysophospholipase
MSLVIALVHGYTGSPDDLGKLYEELCGIYANENVINICLAGHSGKKTPIFDEESFYECILLSVDKFIKEKRNIVFIGHSTGGSILLNFFDKTYITPYSLILIATPNKITADYFSRWEKHSAGKEIPLTSVARMVSVINKSGKKKYGEKFPVLIIHGESDSLVPTDEAHAWMNGIFAGPARKVIIPSADHAVFQGCGRRYAIDIIKRFLSDVDAMQNEEDTKAIKKFLAGEPQLGDFLSASPFSATHIMRCPAGQKVLKNKPKLEVTAANDPVFANIEITSYCNLACRFCARTLYGKNSQHMNLSMFSQILDVLPHAYHVTLVGLGEPLLHPEIAAVVAQASVQKRKVSLVTNGMLLDKSLSVELLNAGLSSIVFSIDSTHQDLLRKLKPGSNLEKIIENIKCFMELNKSNRQIPTTAFSAVSVDTAFQIKDLIDLVSGLGLDALMLTDLNFKENQESTIWKNSDENMRSTIHKVVAHGFSKRLPVMSVRGLEAIGIAVGYKDFLLLPPGQLWNRSSSRSYCFSPWQTIPVDVNGNVTICDCQPQQTIGNLINTPFSELWNGVSMIEHRTKMLGESPPSCCRICPRF